MKRMIGILPLLAAGVFSTAGSGLLAQSTTGTNLQQNDNKSTSSMKLSAVDKTFMMKAEQSNLAEIKTSELAQQKATGENYKNFAQQMIDDHTTAENDLKQLAQSKGVTLTNDPGPKNRAAAARLTRLNGTAFDVNYRRIQHDGHAATIALFRKEIRSGQDADVKAYAQKYLPKIEEHYRMLAELKNSSKMNHSKMTGQK